jgi:hypothetical protein
MAETNFGKEAIEALERALNLKLPNDCEIECTIRNFKANPEGLAEAIKVRIVRESGDASSFDVTRLLGSLSHAHRS